MDKCVGLYYALYKGRVDDDNLRNEAWEWMSSFILMIGVIFSNGMI